MVPALPLGTDIIALNATIQTPAAGNVNPFVVIVSKTPVPAAEALMAVFPITSPVVYPIMSVVYVIEVAGPIIPAFVFNLTVVVRSGSV
jgi:hypothetical protein